MNIKLSADKAKHLLDDSMLDRIVNAVGIPFNGDRDALRHHLLVYYRQYTIASGPGSSLRRLRTPMVPPLVSSC